MVPNVEKNNALITLAEGPGGQFLRADFPTLSPAEQVFRLVWELEAELNSGGFHQYYASRAADRARLAADAFERIDAPAMAEIIRQANAIFGPDGPPPERDERTGQLAALEDAAHARLGELDADFHAYPDNLTDGLHALVLANRPQFRDVGPDF